MMEVEMTRRKWLDKFVKFSATVVATLVGIPALAFLSIPAFRREETPWIRVGPLSEFRPHEPKPVTLTYQRRDGWVIKTSRTTVYVVFLSDSKIKVLSNICSHANCAVRWEREKQLFYCPCHDGFFAIDGSVKSGPPTQPLYEFPHKIEGGEIFVKLQG